MPLFSVRPQFKPISLQTNLDPPSFAFCSPHPASLTQLDSGFNIQFLEIQLLRCPEGNRVFPSSRCPSPGINAEAFRAGLVNDAPID
jgi:hypothetical protein